MVEPKTDRELLRDYTERGSESAFQALVERHLDLVFATAHRGLSDAGAAQEISQNVFIALARKAAWLRSETSLAGWLHKTTLLEVRRWWRGELRRQRREQTAAELGTTMKDEDSLLNALAGELDEGLLELREKDRTALMLRYFEGRSHREIGVLLGAREDAVRMRIHKALEQLTGFFQRRGYAVPAAATTATLLSASAKAAPAGAVLLVTRLATTAAGGGGVTGLRLLIAKLMGLSKAQTAILCVTLAAAPFAWEWNMNHMSLKQEAIAQSNLEAVRRQQEQSSADLAGLGAESARLDLALADAANNQAHYDAVVRKLEGLKARVQALLTNADYQWPGDLPYVRVSKSVVGSLDLLDEWPGTFTPSGTLTDTARELLGVTTDEEEPTERALADYWHGALGMMTASAYETNSPSAQAGRLTKTVIVPPLGQPLKTLAAATRDQLVDILGAEREKLLFGDWAQGGIQTYWPGNLWNISEHPQTFTVWVDPAKTNPSAWYGAAWDGPLGGQSSQGAYSLGFFPRGIFASFFAPWLQQFGIPPRSN
jgi:RNA polymerase sigma factor (sigma-70 family)